MRCNPPLNPLIDAGAQVIFLVRFFAREKGGEGDKYSSAQMQDRMMEIMFSAPLEKEIEIIQAVSKLKGTEGVRVIDPTNNEAFYEGQPMRVEAFCDLVQNRLDFFSHHEVLSHSRWRSMFDEGRAVGKAIIDQYVSMGVFE